MSKSNNIFEPIYNQIHAAFSVYNIHLLVTCLVTSFMEQGSGGMNRSRMARDSEMEDSQNTWKYIILLSKFIFSCIHVSISKSFGVLIPTMMIVLQTNTRTAGFRV